MLINIKLTTAEDVSLYEARADINR